MDALMYSEFPSAPSVFLARIGMKKISKQTVRSKAVGSVLASLRIEKLTPGDYVVKGMHECLSGQRTTVNVLQEVMRHHVPLRRV